MENWIMLALSVVVVFLLFREFWTWYWKQSQQLEVLKDIRNSLRRLEAGAPAPAAPATGRTVRNWRDLILDGVNAPRVRA